MPKEWEALELVECIFELQIWLRGDFVPNIKPRIKPVEMMTLIEIDKNPRMPMKHYATRAGIQSGSFTYIATKLESKGLISRSQSEEDGRQKVLDLTDAGRILTHEVGRQFREHLTRRLSRLNEQEVDELRDVTFTVQNIIEKLETR